MSAIVARALSDTGRNVPGFNDPRRRLLWLYRRLTLEARDVPSTPQIALLLTAVSGRRQRVITGGQPAREGRYRRSDGHYGRTDGPYGGEMTDGGRTG